MPTNTAAASTPNIAVYGPRALPVPAMSTSRPAAIAASSGTAATMPSVAPITTSRTASAHGTPELVSDPTIGATISADHTPSASASAPCTTRGMPPTNVVTTAVATAPRRPSTTTSHGDT